METFGIVLKGTRVELVIDGDSAEDAKSVLKKIAAPLETKFGFTVNFTDGAVPKHETQLDVI